MDSFFCGQQGEGRIQLCSKMSQHEVSINIPVREDMIQSAVNFLSNPKVAYGSRRDKEDFLRSRGCSAEELRIAFERLGAATSGPSSSPSRAFQPQMYSDSLVPSTFQKFRDVLETVSLISGLAYGLYYLFKNVVFPFLFGKPKKPEGVEGAVVDLNKSITESIGQLRSDVQKLHQDLEKISTVQNEEKAAIRNLGDIKSEVATVRGILLNRHQFPTVNIAGTGSIPAWQMSACADRSGEAMASSNNGSQGSDSSLEMIKESEVAEADT